MIEIKIQTQIQIHIKIKVQIQIRIQIQQGARMSTFSFDTKFGFNRVLSGKAQTSLKNISKLLM